MECKICLKKMSSYLDGYLDEKTKQEFLEHINECNSCRKELEMMEDLNKALHNLPDMEAPSRFHNNWLKAIEEENITKKRNIFTLRESKRFLPVITVVAVAILIIMVPNTTDKQEFQNGIKKVSLESPEIENKTLDTMKMAPTEDSVAENKSEDSNMLKMQDTAPEEKVASEFAGDETSMGIQQVPPDEKMFAKEAVENILLEVEGERNTINMLEEYLKSRNLEYVIQDEGNADKYSLSTSSMEVDLLIQHLKEQGVKYRTEADLTIKKDFLNLEILVNK